jgi:hypothetical protein
MATTIETTLPGIGQYKTQIPVKVTNVQLNSPERGWANYYKEEDIVQQQQQQAENKGQFRYFDTRPFMHGFEIKDSTVLKGWVHL